MYQHCPPQVLLWILQLAYAESILNIIRIGKCTRIYNASAQNSQIFVVHEINATCIGHLLKPYASHCLVHHTRVQYVHDITIKKIMCFFTFLWRLHLNSVMESGTKQWMPFFECLVWLYMEVLNFTWNVLGFNPERRMIHHCTHQWDYVMSKMM